MSAHISCTEMEAIHNPSLTDREIEILRLASNGETCESSASILGICMEYVKKLRYRSQLKLGADNTTQAVAMALRRGLIQ